LLGVVTLVAAAATGGQAQGVNGRCAQALPRGVAVPAPIVVTTRCGRFRIQPGGDVVYKGRRTLPVPKGSSYFMDYTWYRLSRHHLLIGRGLKQLWRSRNRYRTMGWIGRIVLGGRELSFSYGGRLYVAPYGGAERVLARGEDPVAFFSGRLLTWRIHGFGLVLRGPGTVVVPHAVDPQWDWASGVVVFRTGHRLRAFDGVRTWQLANRYALGVRGMPVVELLGGLVSIHDARRIAVLNYEGRLIASAPLPRRRARADAVSSSVVSNRAGTAVAFTATHHARGVETVYVLPAGASRAIARFDRRTDFAGCGSSASVAWHGRWLLYSNSEPTAAVVDSSGRNHAIGLGGVISRLPGVSRDGPFTIAWAPAP
jgi:hypothetical protein